MPPAPAKLRKAYVNLNYPYVVLRFEDGRVSELVQVTDTARWHEALQP